MGADRKCKSKNYERACVLSIRDRKTLHRDWSAIGSRLREHLLYQNRLLWEDKSILYGMMIMWYFLIANSKEESEQQNSKSNNPNQYKFSQNVDEIRDWFAIAPRLLNPPE